MFRSIRQSFILLSFATFSFALVSGQPVAKSGQEDKGLRVVCYYGSWASYRTGDANFQVEDADPALCTHFVYAFAGLDSATSQIVSLDPYLDTPENGGRNGFGRAAHLRVSNPGLKVLLAVGGANEGSYKYSTMAGDARRRAAFVGSVVALIRAQGFDGLDLDWEFPGSRGGAVADVVNLVVLLKELREEFDKHGWLLTIAVGVGKGTVDLAYDIPQVVKYVDFVNLMTYDLRGSWDGKTGHHTQQYENPSDQGISAYYNLNSSVHIWLNAGAPAAKLNLGMAAYGKTFHVLYNNGPLDNPSVGPGTAGPYTKQAGFIGYNEFCGKLVNEVWRVETDNYVRAPWAYKDDQWIAYDNIASITEKSNWGKSLGLGGGMLWSIETDDFLGQCGDGKFPLLSAVNSVWRDGTAPATTVAPPETATTPTKGPGVTVTTTANPLYEGCNSQGLNGLSADPEDCSSYFQCAPNFNGGSWIRQTCPHGLYFNENLQICDYTPGNTCNLIL